MSPTPDRGTSGFISLSSRYTVVVILHADEGAHGRADPRCTSILAVPGVHGRGADMQVPCRTSDVTQRIQRFLDGGVFLSKR